MLKYSIQKVQFSSRKITHTHTHTCNSGSAGPSYTPSVHMLNSIILITLRHCSGLYGPIKMWAPQEKECLAQSRSLIHVGEWFNEWSIGDISDAASFLLHFLILLLTPTECPLTPRSWCHKIISSMSSTKLPPKQKLFTSKDMLFLTCSS